MPTRRPFLAQLGQIGGFGAAYVIMRSIGLLPARLLRMPARCNLLPAAGKGKRVVILGSGIAGMVAGWELRKAGYQCC